jgi:hypothetical protein
VNGNERKVLDIVSKGPVTRYGVAKELCTDVSAILGRFEREGLVAKRKRECSTNEHGTNGTGYKVFYRMTTHGKVYYSLLKHGKVTE